MQGFSYDEFWWLGLGRAVDKEVCSRNSLNLRPKSPWVLTNITCSWLMTAWTSYTELRSGLGPRPSKKFSSLAPYELHSGHNIVVVVEINPKHFLTMRDKRYTRKRPNNHLISNEEQAWTLAKWYNSCWRARHSDQNEAGQGRRVLDSPKFF